LVEYLMNLEEQIRFLNHILVWIDPNNPMKMELYQVIQQLKDQKG
jgi:hypothetical protein